MGYFIRVLGTQDPDIHLDELLEALHTKDLDAKIALSEGEQANKWTVIQISNGNGEILSQVERNLVIEGSLGKDELIEFMEEIQDCQPKSAVQWLINYFDNVKVIYAFQLFKAAFEDENFDIISCLKALIWNKTSGILQADNEGFSNDEGYHILWQFSEDVDGAWSCAVLNPSGEWENFIMDLGDQTQRQEFRRGEVPKNAKR